MPPATSQHHRMALGVGLARHVLVDETVSVHHQAVAQQGGAPKLLHQRVGEFVEGV